MRVLILLLILLSPFPTLAQENDSNCGNGLPCGSLPWALPTFPAMPSPTPIDVDAVRDGFEEPPPTSTAIATIVNLDPVSDAVSTLQNSVIATPIFWEIEGTPMAAEEIVENYVGDSGQIFSYIKGLNDNSLGVIAPLVNFSIIAMGLVLVTQINNFLLPLAFGVLGFIRKLITLILDFWPF